MTNLSEERVVQEFERRRKRMLQNFGIAMLLVLISLVLREIVDSIPNLLGIGAKGWYGLTIAQFVAAVVFALKGFFQYRCPVCEEIVRGHDQYYLGVAINPTHCSKCGAKLS